jgi:hypothetical protein
VYQAHAPTTKERNAIQREVTRLLDDLAPERVNLRVNVPVADIQQHRTPNGCVLQASNAALSVTWYAEATDQPRVGELQIVLWRGVVSRRGSTRSQTPAEVVRQEVLNPVEQPADRPADQPEWISRDGAVYTTPDLVAHCLKLLDDQMRAGDMG